MSRMRHGVGLAVVCCALLGGSVRGEEASANVPEEIAGGWVYGTIGLTQFWDDHTGKNLGPGRGMGQVIVFEKDGTYKQYVYIQTRNHHWVTQIWTSYEGKAEFDGQKVTLTPSSGKYKVADNQVKRNNYERAMTEEELKKAKATHFWSVAKNDQDKVQLKLGEDKNQPTVFSKSEIPQKK